MTRPMATVIAPNVIIFKVRSSQYKITSAVKMETGMEMTDIIVDRKFFKNKKIMIAANSPPNNAFSTIEYTDSSIGFAWSKEYSTANPSMFFCSFSIKSFTAFTTWTVLACWPLKI